MEIFGCKLSLESKEDIFSLRTMRSSVTTRKYSFFLLGKSQKKPHFHDGCAGIKRTVNDRGQSATARVFWTNQKPS